MSELFGLLRSGRDPVVFAEEILGIRLNPAQKRWFSVLVTKDGEWANRLSVMVSANQCGKTLGAAILVLWATLYKFGNATADPDKWAEAPYFWFHVAPSQNQAYMALKDIELLVRGAHPAQVNPCQLPPGLVIFEKVDTYYDGFRTILGAEAQFRTTEDKARALQGRRAHGITFDEAAFEIHLRAVLNEVLSMRLISTGGPMIVVSTPNGINEYFELASTIKDQAVMQPNTDGQVWLTDDGQALVFATVADNVGYGLTAREVERKERDLDPNTKEQQLRGAFLEPSEAFFVPQKQIERAFRVLPEYVEPQPGKVYIAFWDPAVSSDPMAAYVLDVTRKPWRVVQEVYERKPSGFNSMLAQMYGIHVQRNGALDQVRGKSVCLTGYDETGMGGKIVMQQLAGLTPNRGLDFAGTNRIKLDVLVNLRQALLDGDLLLPSGYHGLRRELLSYRLADTRIQQDRVMALAGAAWLASRGFSGIANARFDPHAQVARAAMR
ncbi:MAG: terminase large subunit domain-containing protein [Luteimonas sp.]